MRTVTIFALGIEDFKVGHRMTLISCEGNQTQQSCVCVYFVNEIDEIVYFYDIEEPDITGYFSIGDLSSNGIISDGYQKTQIIQLYNEKGKTIWSRPF